MPAGKNLYRADKFIKVWFKVSAWIVFLSVWVACGHGTDTYSEIYFGSDIVWQGIYHGLRPIGGDPLGFSIREESLKLSNTNLLYKIWINLVLHRLIQIVTVATKTDSRNFIEGIK